MKDNDRQPKIVRLQDYQPPAFLIDQIDLEFDLDPAATQVQSSLKIRRNPQANDPSAPLVLAGEELELLSLALNGEPLSEQDYQTDEQSLTVERLPDQFQLRVCTRVCPEKNTALEGLYISGGNFCTQCEAEGFRRITYYLDRPDVLARFSVQIRADAKCYPVLLSNGNRVEGGELRDGRHWVHWQDPFPKPCYLFALVAGDLACIEDRFTTVSGRDVALQIYVQHHNRDRCQHAMDALKKSMRWDEQRFGLEYDLDVYMIVAVDDFNMGAMENKGLNIFNSKFVLANPDTAIDSDFQNIEGVIAHEYFHNWTGNRVTCRDWFQLSLKEGLTVFRDQEFSADVSARTVKRIQDVRLLRTAQFNEDAGPMAHPIRPDSYMEINNFYTVTVYEKGAEVIRMQHLLLGEDKFRRGMELYFSRFDGQAVTTDDFVQAMEDASGVDLQQFRLWYAQAGTPCLQVSGQFDARKKQYVLSFTQTIPPTPGQPDKKAMHIPVAVGLLDKNGGSLPLLTSDGQRAGDTLVLSVTAAEQRVVFTDIAESPIPSLLRGFSAPINLEYDYSDDELRLLMMHDSDDYNRWEACQRYAERVIWQTVDSQETDSQSSSRQAFIDAFAIVLEDQQRDLGLIAEMLSLPSEKFLAEQRVPRDPQLIHSVREELCLNIANHLSELLRYRYLELQQEDYLLDSSAIGERALKNLCLEYLMQRGNADAVELCVAQYRQANNMTDRLAALTLLVDRGGALADDVLSDFYERYKQDTLVMDKWLAIQAGSKRSDGLQHVKDLLRHPVFNLSNPNKVRALLGMFCLNNPSQFHLPSGEAYTFLADQIIRLDSLNPQVAARLVSAFNSWRYLIEPQQSLMQAQLQRILSESGISRDVYEIVSKALA